MNIALELIDLPERDLRAHVDEDALDELAASLRDQGQLQAIGVKAKDDGRYEVVFGARRTRAARILHWQEIRADIITENGHGTTQAAKLIENVQREPLTPIEEAYGLLDLIGDGAADVRELQRQTGKSREWIKTRLELAELPEDLQGAVQAGVIGIGVARAFGRIANDDVREQYIRAAAENGCTTDQAAIWANQAEFAATGIMTMQEIQRTGEASIDVSQTEERHYNCFICKGVHSWRRISTVVICGTCIDAVAGTTDKMPDHPSPTALDTDDTIVAD